MRLAGTTTVFKTGGRERPDMASIGDWWVASHEPRPGETVGWEGKAIRVRPSGSRVGGKLYVTDERVLFGPHLLELLFGADAVGFDLDTVGAIDRDEAGKRGPSSQVHFKRFDHEHETFGVAEADDLVDHLDGRLTIQADG